MQPDGPLFDLGLTLTRRRFFARTAGTIGAALGTSALAHCLGAEAGAGRIGPRPRARRVIYMHMEGAPSQLDLFDYKPELRARFDQHLPHSIPHGQRLHPPTSRPHTLPAP